MDLTGRAQVQINRKAEDRLRSGHPWIFESDVLDAGSAEPGSTVTVVSHRKRALGTAHYSSTSQIRLRMLDRRVIEDDAGFYAERLDRALAYRDFLGRGATCRIIHAEADCLPGLVVDRYGDAVVLQALTQAMDRATPQIVEVLRERLTPRAIVARNDAPVRQRENLPQSKAVLYGEVPPELTVDLNGLAFGVDLLEGQKTGVFLDQRENYAAAAKFAPLAADAKALDLFTSTGGFALHLARAGCPRVEAVDTSQPALDTAEANRIRNGLTGVTFRKADVFEILQAYVSAHRRFDLVVLDPPAFAKSRSALDGAARGYREINQRALKLLSPGGVLVTCSCSQNFSEAALLETLAEAALDAGRTLRVLERRTQALDHPVLLTVPETHYLKCLIVQAVE